MKIGIDLGGSKYRIGLVNSEAELVGNSIRVAIKDINKADDLVNSIQNSINDLISSNDIDQEEIEGIGIGSPGPLDIHTGVILETPNLTYLRGYPIVDRISKGVSMNVVIGNDANCFVLGQHVAGAAKGFQTVFGITLGTGFGCGLVLEGKLYEGANGTAGEFAGSMYLDGVFEDYISGRGLRKIYEEISGEGLRPLQIENKAREGSDGALEAFNEFGKHIGSALSYVVNLVDPEVIVVGGSIANAYDLFIDDLKESLLSKIYSKPAENLLVKQAEDGEINAIIGAATLFDKRR